MSLIRRIAGASGLVALASAMPASAQITPEQVWDLLRNLSESTGQSLTVESQRRDGDRLLLDGVTSTYTSPTTTARVPMGQVVLRDRGDGTVEGTFAPRFDVTVSVREPDSEPVEMSMLLEQTGYTAIVSGTPEAPVFDITADSVSMTQNPPVVNGTPVPMEMVIALTDLQGRLTLAGSAPRQFTYTLTAGATEVSTAATDPRNGATTEASFAADSISGEFSGNLPAGIGLDTKPEALLAAGLTVKGGYRTGPSEFTFALSKDGQDTNLVGTFAESALQIGFDAEAFSYALTTGAFEAQASGDQIPFPDLRITAESMNFGLSMPLKRSLEPVDFGFSLGLVGFSLPDSVWAMVDPTASLPRDPATLVLDTSGKIRLLEDLTSSTPSVDPTKTAETHALTIKRLQLKAAGADLTGTGDFTFDVTDTQTYPGFPRPMGRADLNLTGGNALLDKLVGLGIVPQDQAMGFRMMLALFARPGAGPDTLTSTLEITPEGQILANGQRIQ